MNDQFLVTKKDLMAMMLSAYKCGEWMQASDAHEMVEKLIEFKNNDVVSDEEIAACEILEAIIDKFLITINQN